MSADFVETFHRFALTFEGAYEDHPFGDDSTVFKNDKGKIFTWCHVDGEMPLDITMKLTPDEAEEALMFPFVSVARYLGRYGWVSTAVSTPEELEIAMDWVARSYELVAKTSPRKPR